jgi:hypothetical protein
MPWVEFKPMIRACERAKAVHGSDRVATVIGTFIDYNAKISPSINEMKIILIKTTSLFQIP